MPVSRVALAALALLLPALAAGQAATPTPAPAPAAAASADAATRILYHEPRNNAFHRNGLLFDSVCFQEPEGLPRFVQFVHSRA